MKISEIKKEIIVGLISFIFGGVLFLFFQNYVDRPKPQISVKDISFDNNSGETIEVPSKYLQKSDELISFSKYMDYHEVLSQEQKTGNLLNRLKELKVLLTKWRDENKLSSVNDSLPTEIATFPILNNLDYAKIFITSIKGLKPNFIPVSTEVLGHAVTMVDVTIDTKANVLSVVVGSREMKINDFSATTTNDMTILNNLIYTIRKNNRPNLKFYTQTCLADINERISTYQETLQDLQSLLIDNSRIKIKVTIYNNGKDAVVLHPYFKLEVFNDKNIEEKYLLNTINWERDDTKPLFDYLNEMKTMMKEETGNTIEKKNYSTNDYKSFFQDRKTFPHLSIPGGQNITVILESAPNIGSNGMNIKKWFESGALFCRVEGLTVDNDKVNSPEILFNANIQDKIKTKLGL